MRKIINKKVYDTETAKVIAEYEHSYRCEFDYSLETLYKKKTGEYFLHGYGHAASKYAVRDGNMSGPGSKIIPLTFEQAEEWAADNLPVSEYEEEFGEIIEDESRVNVTVSLSVSAAELLKRNAARTGESVSALIDEFAYSLAWEPGNPEVERVSI